MDKKERDEWVALHWNEAVCTGNGQDYLHSPDHYLFAGPCQHLRGAKTRAKALTERFDAFFRDVPRQTLHNFDRNREGVAEAYHKAVYISEHWQRGLVIQGHTGTGKTHLAKGLVFAACEAGKRPFWASSVWLAKLFRDAQGYEQGAKDAKTKLAEATSAEVLVIDDIGTQRRTDSGVWEEQLTELVDGYRGVLIVTTNLVKQDFLAAVGAKVRSRITAKCDSAKTGGKDYRVEHRAVLPDAPHAGG